MIARRCLRSGITGVGLGVLESWTIFSIEFIRRSLEGVRYRRRSREIDMKPIPTIRPIANAAKMVAPRGNDSSIGKGQTLNSVNFRLVTAKMHATVINESKIMPQINFTRNRKTVTRAKVS